MAGLHQPNRLTVRYLTLNAINGTDNRNVLGIIHFSEEKRMWDRVCAYLRVINLLDILKRFLLMPLATLCALYAGLMSREEQFGLALLIRAQTTQNRV